MSVLQDCPRCGAMVRPDAQWCSLCFARFDAADETHPSSSPPEGVPTPVAVLDAPLDPLTAPLDQLVQAADPAAVPARPAAAGSAVAEQPASVGPVGDPTDVGSAPLGEGPDVDAMLALLAAEHHQQDPLGTWGERLGDRTTRFLVMAGGVLVVSLALFAVLSVLSLLA